MSQSIPTVVQSSKSWLCFSREQYSFTLPPSSPSLGGIQAQCLLEPGWGKQEAQSCGLPLGPFHPDPVLCPLWGKAITVRRGDQEMACPFLNSDQPENIHCTSLEGPFGCNVRESDLPLGARQHQEFSAGLQPVPIPAQSHRRYLALLPRGWSGLFLLASLR